VNSAAPGPIFIQIYGFGGNPLKYTDPDGKTDIDTMLVGKQQIDQGLLLQAVGIGAIAGTIADDVLSGGAGVANDVTTIITASEMISKGTDLTQIGFATLESGAAKGNTPNAENNTGARVRSVLNYLPNGRSPGVKTVNSEQELKNLFNSLADGGSVNIMSRYNGVGVTLKDETSINYRLISSKKSGGSPTIDIKFPDDKTSYKVHIYDGK
jgi:hypothetical protein